MALFILSLKTKYICPSTSNLCETSSNNLRALSKKLKLKFTKMIKTLFFRPLLSQGNVDNAIYSMLFLMVGNIYSQFKSICFDLF